MNNSKNENLGSELNEMMNQEAARHAQVAEAKSIFDLIVCISKMSEVPGSRIVFTPAQEIALILALVNRKPEVNIKMITRTYGIREKVYEFLNNKQL